nr:EOG090X0AW0 [Triops cancriformis]
MAGTGQMLIFRVALLDNFISWFVLLAYSKNPGPIFFDTRVQSLLKQLTGCKYDKVFEPKKLGDKLENPTYKFMTQEELDKALEEAKRKAEDKLQMPPLLEERKPINEVLSSDPEIQGLDNCSYVFTDITYGVSDRKRVIVVRDPDGTLRKASWEERAKMNQIYFPQRGRQITPSKMFQEEYLNVQFECLKRHDYLFVLDRACIQFEPDDPEYIRVTRTTYDHIDQHRQYDTLHSTRHYGPMVLHLVLSKKQDNLLVELMKNMRSEDAFNLVKLYHTTFPESPSSQEKGDDLAKLKAYITEDSLKRGDLELLYEAYLEIAQQKATFVASS